MLPVEPCVRPRSNKDLARVHNEFAQAGFFGHVSSTSSASVKKSSLPKLPDFRVIATSCSSVLSKAPRNTWRDFRSDIELPDFQSFGHCTRRLATRDDKTPETKIARFDGAGGKRRLDDRPSPFEFRACPAPHGLRVGAAVA